MKGTKQARKFGGRPVEREPEPGKRAHLSLAVPLSLKRKVEQAAKKRGWSVSNEAAHRLEMSFSRRCDDRRRAENCTGRADPALGTWPGLTGTVAETEKKRSG